MKARLALLAARNNAEWCGLVCRTHGLSTFADGRMWSSPLRTPTLYPDAVTLTPKVDVSEVFPRIDPSPGCSVKDSFASLELSAAGFRVLFDAQWLYSSRQPLSVDSGSSVVDVSDNPWLPITSVEEFYVWEQAWRGSDGPVGVLRPELLQFDDVRVLAVNDGSEIVAGVMLYRSAEVVGVTNFFAANDSAKLWAGLLVRTSEMFPELPVVGYESGPALADALQAGFETIGPLRVWLRDDLRA